MEVTVMAYYRKDFCFQSVLKYKVLRTIILGGASMKKNYSRIIWRSIDWFNLLEVHFGSVYHK